jgi:hypothetical protein
MTKVYTGATMSLDGYIAGVNGDTIASQCLNEGVDVTHLRYRVRYS